MNPIDLNVQFENPEKKPLGELVFPIQENGVRIKIPALDKRWVTTRSHTKYIAFPITSPNKVIDSAALDEWLSVAEQVSEEIASLLSMEHFRFWSSMVYDPGYITSIITFLQAAIPFYTPITGLTVDTNVLNLYKKIHENCIRIICRLITNRESETEWITREHLADLIYSKFLISIPMLFDLTIAYGRSNHKLLQRIFQTIFTIQPKYQSDLGESMEFSKHAFDMIQATINANENQTSFDDLTMYTLDCAASINILFEIYPGAIPMALKCHLEQAITNFYDSAMPPLYKHIVQVNPDANCLRFLSQARIELLGTFRSMANYYLDQILANPTKSAGPAEQFLAILHEALADHLFVIDYQRQYSILADIDIICQACTDLEKLKIDYIIGAYTSDTKQQQQSQETDAAASDENYPEECMPSTSSHNTNDDGPDQNIQTVLDILPHLKLNFVQVLLTRYDTPDMAIAAVLEGNLPPDLEELQNQHLLYQDENDGDDEPSPATVLNELSKNGRISVVMKTGKGMPGAAKSATALLDDKSHIKELRKRYELLGFVSEDEYDDEYDDSYEALADSESKAVNALRKTGANNYVADEESDGSEDDDDDDDNGPTNANNGATASGIQQHREKNRDFCENPEVARARWAQSRNSKYMARHKGKPPSAASDVVGKPKGQGQDGNVVRNRQVKDEHKSTRANHNRRQGAAWKRNRGMIPS